MRLLDTWTGQFVEKDPSDPETKYAILSHTWDAEGEQTYQELRDIQKRHTPPPSRPARQPQKPARDVLSSSPFPVERHQDVSSLPDSSATPCHDSIPTTPPAVQEPEASSPAPPAPRASGSRSRMTAEVAPSPDVPQGHSKPSLSPIWDDPELCPKIRGACKVARDNGYRYLWIDSCCIDKTSSSELSEAINSMYRWYSLAVVCYAFLADVPAEENHEKEGSKFRGSRWFTRGWTLQELIAPVYVRFFSMEWTFIGSKHSLTDLITQITKIADTALLRLRPRSKFSVAQRLSWAAKRTTTRVEDRAYSLLGLFDINMPALYGEGQRAFRRLQEEIMRHSPDQTLFAWTSCSLTSSPTDDYEPGRATIRLSVPSKTIPELGHPSLLAPSLDLFSECGGITPVPRDEVVRRLRLQWHRLHLPVADYYFTPYGIRTHFPVIELSTYIPTTRNERNVRPSRFFLTILQCEHESHPGHLLGRVSYTRPSSYTVEFSFGGCMKIGPHFVKHLDLLPLSPRRFKRLRWQPSRPIAIKTLYIQHADGRDGGSLLDVHYKPHETINLVLQKKTRDALRAHGYIVDLRGPDHNPDQPTIHRLTLSRDTHAITIEYEHTLEERRIGLDTNATQLLTIEARWHVEMLRTQLGTYFGELPRMVQATRGTMSWIGCRPWAHNLPEGVQGFQLPAAIGGTGELWVTNRLTFASTDHYLLHVELTRKSPNPTPVMSQPSARGWKRWLRQLVART